MQRACRCLMARETSTAIGAKRFPGQGIQRNHERRGETDRPQGCRTQDFAFVAILRFQKRADQQCGPKRKRAFRGQEEIEERLGLGFVFACFGIMKVRDRTSV